MTLRDCGGLWRLLKHCVETLKDQAITQIKFSLNFLTSQAGCILLRLHCDIVSYFLSKLSGSGNSSFIVTTLGSKSIPGRRQLVFTVIKHISMYLLYHISHNFYSDFVCLCGAETEYLQLHLMKDAEPFYFLYWEEKGHFKSVW